MDNLSFETQRVDVTHTKTESNVSISSVCLKDQWVIQEHSLNGVGVLPSTAYIDIVYGAYTSMEGIRSCIIRNFTVVYPITVYEHNECKNIRTTLRRLDKDRIEFIVSSQEIVTEENYKVIEHARGLLTSVAQDQSSNRVDLEELMNRFSSDEMLSVDELQCPIEGHLQFGPRWNNIKKVRLGATECLAMLELPAEFLHDLSECFLHPAMFDRAIHNYFGHKYKHAYIPYSCESIKVQGRIEKELISHICLLQIKNGVATLNVSIYNMEGELVLELEHLKLLQASKDLYGLYQLKERRYKPETNKLSIHQSSTGDINSLYIHSEERKLPLYDEVEIEVVAASLNFKDILYVLGLVPIQQDNTMRLGQEAAGVVVSVGSGVKNFKIGDEVIVTGHSCLSSYVIAPTNRVILKPGNLSFEEAASISIAYITAYYSLVHLANMSEGETLLIHAASGGVGLAAINIAKYIGVDIIATAGNERKRDYLKGLGINHVFDSRSLTSAEEIIAQTNGQGVDVVLNSLSGEFMKKSLQLLKPFGRFIELGIKDMLNNMTLDLGPFLKNLSFFSLASGQIRNYEKVSKEVLDLIATGKLLPLPIQSYSLSNFKDAISLMAKTNHIGKVVITFHNQEKIENKDYEQRKSAFKSYSDDKPGKIEHLLLELFREHFEKSEFQVDDVFFDIGASSLDLIQIKAELQSILNREISIISFFEYPTIHQLAHFLEIETPKEEINVNNQTMNDLTKKTVKNTLLRMRSTARQ